LEDVVVLPKLVAKGPVLVTGGITGIGRATVDLLSEMGVTVYATARKDEDLEDLGRLKQVIPMKLDVTRQEDVDRVVGMVKSREEGLYGLVNNAATGDIWPLIELTAEDMMSTFDVNVFGVHRVTRGLVPFLAKSHGRIVNISSIAGIGTGGDIGDYAMTKHAVEVYSDVLRKELRRYKIKVSTIEPGEFRSPSIEKGAEVAARRAERYRAVLSQKEIRRVVREAHQYAIQHWKADPPDKVAHAIAHALFSPAPHWRYLVTTDKDDLTYELQVLTAKIIQINRGSEYKLEKDRIHSLLDKTWSKWDEF
jgi:NAD(P)-dependent dehydrogenase (short-subunit alcohol dehydrogenase family)